MTHGQGNVTKRWIRTYAILLGLILLAIVFLSQRTGAASLWFFIGGWLVAVNLLTLHAFWRDKRVAGSAKERTPEALLHTLALIGGTPAAWVAIYNFRHKSRKVAFLIPLLVITFLQGGVLAWLVNNVD